MNYQSPRQSAAADPTRYGTFPMRIGATVKHTLTKGIHLPKANRELAPGESLHQDVRDITRHPEAKGHTFWMCAKTPAIRDCACYGKQFESKEELLAAHLDNRELTKLQEVHCFYAVAHVPAREGKPAVRDKQGNLVTAEVAATGSSFLLLSDEE